MPTCRSVLQLWNMSPLEAHLRARLEERTAAGNLRQLQTGTPAIDFYSNDYLGLATCGILDAAIAAMPHSGAMSGSTGSRLISGNTAAAEALEAMVAGFHRAPAALLFNSGYNANVGLIAAVAAKDTVLLYDELSHASIIDGVRLAVCSRKYKFRHNDLEDLAAKLRMHAGGQVLVITESVFSMDGDVAPLADKVVLCEQYGAQLIVDEAHATGVCGPRGEGLVVAAGLQDRVFARVHTFGKAMGCHGAAVVGSKVLKQYLVNFARPFIYTTALPGHAIAAATAAYQQLLSPGFSTATLLGVVATFKDAIRRAGTPGWLDAPYAIQGWMLGGNDRCKAAAARLQAAGYGVKAILSPTVPAGKERLRICLHSFNTVGEIAGLVERLGEMRK